MKILVLGANGAVGQLAVEELLNANHDVKALVRNASTLQRKHPRLTVVQGEPTNAARPGECPRRTGRGAEHPRCSHK